MSTILSRIRLKIEKRIKENLAEALLDAHIRWHTRKGLRDCDCDFCIQKKAGTRYIGYTPFPLVKYKEKLTKDSDMEEVAREVIKEERERKRRIVRYELFNARRNVL